LNSSEGHQSLRPLKILPYGHRIPTLVHLKTSAIMSRIFTTPFRFRETIYTALVSVHTKDKDLCIQVKLQDEALQGLIPDGRLNLGHCDDSSQLLQGRSAIIKELVASVTEAVHHYLAHHKVAGVA
jgi:hypothetical protein